MSEMSLLTIEQRERVLLAPYAMHSCDSAGRKHAEAEHPYRGPFQRDRDRILHSAAFRRLSGKTQVFTNMGDYYRTRLTHTQEVSSISRTIGRALRLNEDLIEALALFHDIGHPPYGHAGEDALNECLTEHGGFSHNRHALTIAEELEIRYPDFPGLNLSREVLEGQATRTEDGDSGRLLEVQVVDVADSITYDAHDTDDALKLGVLSMEELAAIPLTRRLLPAQPTRLREADQELVRLSIVHELIDLQVSDVLKHSAAGLAERDFQSAAEAKSSNFRIGPGEELAEEKRELEAFLYQRVYRHPNLLEFRGQARTRLHAMFQRFLEQPAQLPDKVLARANRVGLARSVGEYLAGMTDRFCDEVWTSGVAEM